MQLIVLLFKDFETLDVFGPVHLLGKMKNAFDIYFVSQNGGITVSSQQVHIVTFDSKTFKKSNDYVFVVPGGKGTRDAVNNEELLKIIREFSENAKFVLSVCTGAALLAKAGVLDGKNATSYKGAFDWVTSQSDKVNWIRKARWVKDGKFYSSSGVSAGSDMALGFIADHYGLKAAEDIAWGTEYIWNKDSENDIFAV
jgi:putative intracellular protease/amidase